MTGKFLIIVGAFIGINPSIFIAQIPKQDVDIDILQSDANSCVVEYLPRYSEPEKLLLGGNDFTRYGFEQSIRSLSQSTGEPALFSRSLLLQFPGLNNNSVDVLNVDYEDIKNILLVPVPKFREGEVDPEAEYSINPESYTRQGFFPTMIASLDHIGETRGAFLGNLRFYPLQYDAARRTVRKYNRIVIRINYGMSTMPNKPVEGARSFAMNEKVFSSVPPASQVLAKKNLRNSVLSSGTWYRFTVDESGMYKLTGQALLNAGIPSSTDPHTIKIFSNGGFEPPLDIRAQVVDDLLQNALYVSDGGTSGTLDASDFILFYGKSTRGWKYSSTSKAYSHYINHFDDNNVYWVTYGGVNGKSMTEVPSGNQIGIAQPRSVNAMVFREDDKNNAFSSGIEWLGESFISGGQIVYRTQLPSLDYSQPIRYKFNLGAVSEVSSFFSVYEHDSLLTTMSVYGDNREYQNYYSSNNTILRLPNFSEEQSQLRFRYSNSSPGGRGYIDWCEIYYQRFLQAQNDVFNFHTVDTSGWIEYEINRFSGGQVFVFDVTKFDSVLWISAPMISADTCTFQVDLTQGSPREFIVVGQGGYRTPSTLMSVTNQNLHGDTKEAVYIILTHPNFLSAAQRLQEYREHQSNKPLSTLIVDVNKIYNEFGGGMVSPSAIRNYLRYVYQNWTSPPKYVLLLGDGDYDYKRIQGSAEPNWIPPWESTESFVNLASYASDDHYGIFFAGERVSVGLGRLPVRSLEEANQMVDKIIDYETKSVVDSWKLRFTFVADDGPQAPERNDGTTHMDHAEHVAAQVSSLFEKRKIYLYDYPTVYTSGGRRKPDVNLAIQNAINQGSLVVNFAGHGNPRLWTHEAVFVRETDFQALQNRGKYFFLVAATCNYAIFDMLSERSSGEVLTLMPDAGAIAVFSAVRPVYADKNEDLNIDLFRTLLDTVQFSQIRQQRLGDIIYRTKQYIHEITNDRKYYLLGDPGLFLSFPELIASVDSVNHTGTNQVVDLKALGRATVTATVRDTGSYSPMAFTGRAQIIVYDANRVNTINAPEFRQPYTYATTGSVLFRGQDTVVNGAMRGEFIVPKDISYSKENGRIVIYFSNDSLDGGGYTTNIRINGTDTTAIPDSRGPLIQLYLDRKSFRPGDIVTASPLLIAELTDSSGINTSGAGIGHRLEAWLDDRSESFDLSGHYQSKINTYKEGIIEYPVGNLSSGTHKLKLRAWDTYNNPSSEETMFNVVTGSGLQLSNVFNYPNPFSASTVFTFEHNQVSSLDAEVKIFTVAGRLIQSLKQVNIVDQFVKVSWDGYDKEGDRLANGVYLYKIIAKTRDGRFTSEALGKLSILK